MVPKSREPQAGGRRRRCSGVLGVTRRGRPRACGDGRMNQQTFWVVALLTGLTCAACSSSSDAPPPATTGSACAAPEQCFTALEAGSLHGSAVCLTKPAGGYCTHTCTTDLDCCAVPGECANGRTEVCAPFSSTEGKHCFVSCEDTSVAAAAAASADALCVSAAGPSFSCRSTGGGSENRKFCSP